jgi:hypothetical protein
VAFSLGATLFFGTLFADIAIARVFSREIIACSSSELE